MKTLGVFETELTENGINSRLNHKTFLEYSAKAPSAKAKKIVRNVDKANLGVLAMLGLADYTARTNISVHPEFVAYAFHLYGLSRKLFLYIIFYELDNDTCRFTIDINMIGRFQEFCFLFGEDAESDKTVQQALKSLIRKNTMIEVSEAEYMLNPLIAGGSSEYKRRKLIDKYSSLLMKKGLDPFLDFYPRYQISS